MNTIGCIYVKCMLASSDELWLQTNRNFCHFPDTTILSPLTFFLKTKTKWKEIPKARPPQKNPTLWKPKRKVSQEHKDYGNKKNLNQAIDENNYILASQPSAENKVTGTCILEN